MNALLNNKGPILMITMVAFEIISQYFLQKGVNYKKIYFKNKYLYFGILGQLLMTLLYFFVLKSGYSLAIANTLIDGGGALGIVLLGYFVFKQKISLLQSLGVALTIIGVVILGMAEK